jgi:hypothetical protein
MPTYRSLPPWRREPPGPRSVARDRARGCGDALTAVTRSMPRQTPPTSVQIDRTVRRDGIKLPSTGPRQSIASPPAVLGCSRGLGCVIRAIAEAVPG